MLSLNDIVKRTFVQGKLGASTIVARWNATLARDGTLVSGGGGFPLKGTEEKKRRGTKDVDLPRDFGLLTYQL